SELSNHPRRDTHGERPRWNIPGHDGSRSDHAALSDGDAAHDDDPRSEPHVLPENDRCGVRGFVATLGLEAVEVVVHDDHVRPDAAPCADTNDLVGSDRAAVVDERALPDLEPASRAGTQLQGGDGRDQARTVTNDQNPRVLDRRPAPQPYLPAE